jgi:N-acetylmuramoyl-L-alanine amidase
MGQLKYLVIHATDTPNGREVSKADITLWHTGPKSQGHRGWSRVGYSDLIQLDGTLINLIEFDQDNIVDNWEISNGAKGFNGVARHVVYAGGGNGEDTRTQPQLEALEAYVKYMVLRHPQIIVIGHNQISTKKCPSFDVTYWLRSICIDEKHIM